MENMSKALIMAASVLIALILIALLVIMFGGLTGSQSEIDKVKETEQIVEYNKKFEVYNRKILYGSDILSIANLIDDYNQTEGKNKGYQEMQVQVTIKKAIPTETSFKIVPGVQSVQSLRNMLVGNASSVTKAIETLESTYNKKGRKSLSSLSDLYLRDEMSYRTEIGKTAYDRLDVDKDRNNYDDLKSILKEFKLKIFTCEANSVTYDTTNGRMLTMNFKEATN